MNKGKPFASTKIKQAQDCPKNMEKKDFFGMGYPYFISIYSTYVACSTDFGVVLLSF